MTRTSLTSQPTATSHALLSAKMAIALLTALCLLAFLLTIPLPRADGHLIGSDGIGYYVYLPSIWLDRDLDFTNEYAVFFAYARDAAPDAAFHLHRTPQGVPPNQWAIGPALLWSPFFLLAHLLALGLQSGGFAVSPDGYGYLYQAIVLSGSILYAGVGAWLTYCFVLRWVQPEAALGGVLLVVLAGNLVYYMTAEPSMSHGVSAFASALFFLLWIRRRDRSDRLTPALLGAAAGLMALIRPQDGLLLALPFLDRLPAVVHGMRTGNFTPLRQWLGAMVIAAVAALVVFTPQLWSWQIIYGSILRSGYLYAGGAFNWFTPKLAQVMLSSERGLLVWHPIFLGALIGLGLLWRIDRRMSVLGLLAVAIQWYVIASWSDWRQGDAFGGRMFIVCTPVFALGVGVLIEWAAARWSWRRVAILGALLLIWNFLLFVEYRFDLVAAQRPVTWHDLTIGRLTKPMDIILARLRQG